MELARRTDIGRVRDLNEDSTGLVLTKSGTVIAIVADGMGGHQAGDVASRETVDTIEKVLRAENLDVSTDEKSDLLLHAVGKANEKVFRMAEQNSQLSGMGTTVIAAIVDQHEVVLAHVGDSRAYMLHKNGLYQLTEDHSYVNILRKNGQITAEEARNHHLRNMIVRAVGTNEDVEVDLINTPWSKDDIFLMCSDGLTTMVSEREIGLVLSSTSMTLDEKADKLIELALEAGGADNISLILLRHTGGSATS
ncbi:MULTISPECIES: Stp1/IreP family PP2C-type Ser/Thr phosphatase [Thermoactinomyces]|jgi:PPM family protein phosphatase|uniref:Stp1/IreP family PP2C-type Ser/Thr phosphatase n=1 Tax=Thermoactinomyces daqus TaxID=1329516 RepID=A0A7W1X981_9BACL|nr:MULTISPECIES: Stp1/IreP family PP2C-type Ser/Thr phosphatase [Thermoactinomyces]MBA4542478.1 Stp1/IreP family PP2C-type Ser/Thr phosphatase [Thermoactinomyces daqus]MBH8598122.1 Stp1/IreP family PP2C-type Ser/Thr phosphatase [Thermoactinomyces sp. CICC 10523]MBH8603153.1 Stp1/IreP family PP2C-type Ser/Thr phosphatase [Thermoactinomyces sp. CICC 10522]MBH8607040.1 Stp1/IreP family PP2C-type Ser/Thr phosphatase [Thermoactinomyces sp. CICC 10521]